MESPYSSRLALPSFRFQTLRRVPEASDRLRQASNEVETLCESICEAIHRKDYL